MSMSSSFSSSFSSNLLPQMQSPLNLFKYLKELFSLPVVFYDFVFLLFIFIFFKFTSSNAEPCGLVLIPEKAIFTTCSFLCLYLPLFHFYFPQIYLLKCRTLWTCLNTRRRYFHYLQSSMSLSSLILYFLFPQIYLLKRRALWSCLNTWNMYFHCLESSMSLSSSFSSSFSSNLRPQVQSPLDLFKFLEVVFSL